MPPKAAKNKGKEVASAASSRAGRSHAGVAPEANPRYVRIAPKGDGEREGRSLLSPPPEKRVPKDNPKVDVDELVTHLEKAGSRQEQVELFGDMCVQTVLKLRESGGKIRDHIDGLGPDIAAAAMRKAVAKLKEQIQGFDYSGLTLMEALKHWTHVTGVWLGLPIQRDLMKTFTKWFVHCHGVTDPADRRRDVKTLCEYAIDLVELHLTYHRPHEEWLMGLEFWPLKPIAPGQRLFDNMNVQWPGYAQIKHRGRKWVDLSDYDADYDDHQRVMGCYARGLEPWFDILTYYAQDFYVHTRDGVAILERQGEERKRINHLTSLYRNGVVREGVLRWSKALTLGGVGDDLAEKLGLPELPSPPWSDNELPIFAYCAHENVNEWAKLAAAGNLEVLWVAWVLENLWVW